MEIVKRVKVRRGKGKLIGAMLVCCGLLLTSLNSHAARFFRFEDENGVLVMSHAIPNDRVKYGYQIVDEHGRVLDTIEPQLSEEAYQRKLEMEAAFKECQQALTRVRNLFQSESDIDYAEEQALESIDTQIGNTKANLSHVRNQREELEAQAAQQDLSGQKISAVLLDNIESAKRQERNLEEQIEKWYEDKLRVRSDYEFDRRVFELKDCDNGLPARQVASR